MRLSMLKQPLMYKLLIYTKDFDWKNNIWDLLNTKYLNFHVKSITLIP